MIDGDMSPPRPGFFKDVPYFLHSTHNLFILRSRTHLSSYVALKIYTRLYNPKIPPWHKATYAIRGWKSCQHSGKNILLKLKTLQKQLSHFFSVKVVWACYPLLCLWMVSGTCTHPLTCQWLQYTSKQQLPWKYQAGFPHTNVSCHPHTWAEWMLTVLGTGSPWVHIESRQIALDNSYTSTLLWYARQYSAILPTNDLITVPKANNVLLTSWD